MSVSVQRPVYLTKWVAGETAADGRLLVLAIGRKPTIGGIIQGFGNHIFLGIAKIFGQIIEYHLINGHARKVVAVPSRIEGLERNSIEVHTKNVPVEKTHGFSISGMFADKLHFTMRLLVVEEQLPDRCCPP